MDRTKHEILMQMAFTLSEVSHARRKKVGCVIVKQHESGFYQIIGDGVNGMRPGTTNQCEDLNGDTLPDCRHAERNALCKLNEMGVYPKGATLYVTHQPCVDCAQRIVDSGIAKVYYCLPYKDRKGLTVLKRNKVEVFNIEPDVICQRLNIPVDENYLSLLERYDASAAIRIKSQHLQLHANSLEELVSSHFR